MLDGRARLSDDLHVDWPGLGKGLLLLAGAGVVYFLAADKREEMLGPAPLDVSHHVQRFKASGHTPLSESEWKLLAGAMFIGGCVLAALMALSGIWVIVIALK